MNDRFADHGVRVVEPAPIKIEYASRLAAIESVDGGAVLVFAQAQFCFEVSQTIHILSHRIFLPSATLLDGLGLIAACAARAVRGIEGERVPRLVSH
jgi:hypothetical protein